MTDKWKRRIRDKTKSKKERESGITREINNKIENERRIQRETGREIERAR